MKEKNETSDLVDQYNSTALELSKMLEEREKINEELDLLTEEQESLEQQLEEKKAQRKPLRQKREALSRQISLKENLLNGLGVKKAIISDREAAANAKAEADRIRAEAEKIHADAASKSKEHEKLIAKRNADLDALQARLEEQLKKAE